MGFEKRGIDPGPGAPYGGSGQTAENDFHVTEYVYNGTTGLLTLGMPLYVDVTDAGEYNSLVTATALSPAVARSGGKVVLGTDAKAGPFPTLVGVYYSENTGAAPTNGETIRVCDRGRAVVSAATKAAGTSVKVGDVLIADTTVTSALSGGSTAVLGKTLGIALATGTAVASTNSIIAVGGSTTTALVNAFIKLV